MPLPLGHTAIGWAANETICPATRRELDRPREVQFARFAFSTFLANLPDMDVLFGLMIYGNGAALHRGPTHSLLFALLAGYLASQAWRLWPRLPHYGFGLCFTLIFSHVAADMLLTSSPVSLLWPMELNLIGGYSGWGQVMHMILFKSIQDFGIIAVCLTYIAALRYFRGQGPIASRLMFARRRTKP